MPYKWTSKISTPAICSVGITKLFSQFKRLIVKIPQHDRTAYRQDNIDLFPFLLCQHYNISKLSLSVFVHLSVHDLSTTYQPPSFICLYFSHLSLSLVPTCKGYQPPEKSLLCYLKMSHMSPLMKSFRFSYHDTSIIFPLFIDRLFYWAVSCATDNMLV